MFWGITLIVFGMAVLIFMRKDFVTEHEISKIFSRKAKRWQGITTAILFIVIGLAQVINS